MSSQARCGCLHFRMNFKAATKMVESFLQTTGSVLGRKSPESNTEVTMWRTAGQFEPKMDALI